MNNFKTAVISGLNEYLDSLYKALDGLNKNELKWQPSLESNNIIYLVWHMARVEDNWINQIIGGNKTVWSLNNWSKKLNIEENERNLLRLSVALMPFMHGVRALTDHLNGNKYFKVSYPDQNLIRAKNLIKFSQVALSNEQYMKKIINS